MTAWSRARVALCYRWRHGRWAQLDRPRRFTEWVQWRKLNDRCATRANFTDKQFSKQHVARLLGDDLIIPTLWTGAVLPDVAPWPMPFIVKANHGRGQYSVVRSRADYARARREAPRWLTLVYGGWLDEAHYRSARRSILVEPFIGTERSLPTDYKVYVFGGQARMVQVHEGRGSHHRWHQYDPGGTPLSTGAAMIDRPASWDRMLDAAQRLGQGHDFLRVDFYDHKGKPLFGEFCLYPGSGLDPFDPPHLDDWLGEMWTAQYDELHEIGISRRQPRPGASLCNPRLQGP